MSREAIGTLAAFVVGWLVYSSLDSPFLRSKAAVYAVLAAIATQRIVVWLITMADDAALSAPKSEPPAESWPDLIRAADSGQAEVVNELLKTGADANVERRDGLTALHVAALKGHTQIAADLINASADVNKAPGGCTPLWYAAANGHVPCVKLLLECGGVVDRASDSGNTPLGIAAEHGQTEAMKLLIENGADVNASAYDPTADVETTPLAMATITGHAEATRLLIEHGAEMNKKLRSGMRYLHCAVMSGSFETVEILVKHGANVNATVDGGRVTAIRAAKKLGHSRIANFLRERGAKEGRLEFMD